MLRKERTLMAIDEHRASRSSVGPATAGAIKSVVAHFVECVNSGKHNEALDHYRNWMTNGVWKVSTVLR